ncbi:hypothetical protein [Arthrobacter mangrovi]|uniref:DUF4435 domain-containing protein n=1 Tax=Arthrobacter mangrovi TaxID=2966350 RepID=A0ABQ5MV71_9MICC|nr:hypothetical protein [Arthrobacter mangrovi]GLB67887.1 hypothetical protein AHIS1636_23270 [Arthrobacter mangrovi]
MTKIPQDIQAFRRRMQMGRTRLWVMVEGRDYDRAFYERLLETVPELEHASVSIRLAEQLSVDGISAGGKKHLLKIFHYLKSEDALTHRNRKGAVAAAFFLDRDIDDFLGTCENDVHVVYTKNMDVESEILANGDLMRALGSSHGLGREHLRPLFRALGDPLSSLAMLWREWILLRLVAARTGLPSSPRFASVSQINEDTYGALDESSLQELKEAVISHVGADNWASEWSLAEQYIGHRLENGEAASLLHGKWIAGYLKHLVRVHLAEEIIKSGTSDREIIASCLETLSYSGAWTDHYVRAVQSIIK